MKKITFFILIMIFSPIIIFSSCTFDSSGIPLKTDAGSDSDVTLSDITDITDVTDTTDVSDITDVTDTTDTTDSGTECIAGETECIDNFTLKTCGNDGTWSTSTCEEGCNSSSSPASCLFFIPSNGLTRTILDVPGTGAWQVTADSVFNSDTGEIKSGDTVIRPAGEGVDLTTGIIYTTHSMSDGRPIAVFGAVSIDVEAEVTLRGFGTLGIILVADSIHIRGIIDVSATSSNCSSNNERCAGPGGYTGGDVNGDGQGPGAGKKGYEEWTTADETGGGGAGYLLKGARGGSDDGGAGGTVYGNTTLEPLIGGSGGGGGGHYELLNDNPGEGHAGGGGGAIQITAFSLLSIGNSTGTPCGVKASGAGGSGNSRYVNSGGGGGGSGGAIILESPFMQLYANVFITANGGGGGAGRSSADGSYGLFSSDPAPGATCSSCNEGGNGGALNTAPTVGNDDEGGDGTGGGGASAGRIAIRNCIDYATMAIISPEPEMAGCHY